MPNVVSTLSQLLAKWLDSPPANITAQTGRNFLVSCFGYMTNTDPGVDNDNVDTAGIGAFFDNGSRWTNTATDTLWFCADGTPGAAVWVPIPPQFLLAMRDVSGSPFSDNITTILSDKTTGLVISITGTSATYTLASCGAAQSGIVDLTDGQVLGAGSKYFQSRVSAGAASDAGLPYPHFPEVDVSSANGIECNGVLWLHNYMQLNYGYVQSGGGGPSTDATLTLGVVDTRAGYNTPAITLTSSDGGDLVGSPFIQFSAGDAELNTLINDAEVTNAIGFTGLGGGGDLFKAGWCINTSTPSGPTLTIGTTPVSGGTPGSLLMYNTMGKLDDFVLSPGQFPLGGSLDKGSFGSEFTIVSDVVHIATGGVTNAMLANDAVTVSAGAGLSGGGTVSLGGSTSLAITSGSITNAMLVNDAVTVSAGTGLTGGGAVSLGGTVSLSMPAVGTAATYGDASHVPQFTTDTEGRISGVTEVAITAGITTATPGIWTRKMEGFRLAYRNSSNVLVGNLESNMFPSVCRDAADAAFITLPVGTQINISLATQGAGGTDEFTAAPTVSTSGASFKTLTLSSGSWETLLGKRTLTSGTYSTGGSPSTTLTFSGPFVPADLAVNDLVGTSTIGYSRVTGWSNVSGTVTLTTATALTVPASSTLNCIEQPIVTIGGSLGTSLDALSTTPTIATATLAQSSLSGALLTISAPAFIAAPTGSYYMYAFVAAGSSGTTAFLSTQRTTPYTFTGYNTSYRRIGTVRFNSAGVILAFTQEGDGNEREYQYDYDPGSNFDYALNGGGATSWTAVDCNTWIPPTATMIAAEFQAVSRNFNVRPRGSGSTSLLRNWYVLNGSATISYRKCDAAQSLEYNAPNAGGSFYIAPTGWKESL